MDLAISVVNACGCCGSFARSILDEGALQVLVIGHVSNVGALTGFVVDCVDVRFGFIATTHGTRHNPIDGACGRIGNSGLGVGIASEGDVEVDHLFNAAVGLADLVKFLCVVGDAVKLTVFVKEKGLDKDLVDHAHLGSGLSLKVNLHKWAIRAVGFPVHLTPEYEVSFSGGLVKSGYLAQVVFFFANNVAALKFPTFGVVGLHDALRTIHLEGVELAACIEGSEASDFGADILLRGLWTGMEANDVVGTARQVVVAAVGML